MLYFFNSELYLTLKEVQGLQKARCDGKMLYQTIPKGTTEGQVTKSVDTGMTKRSLTC